MRILDHLHNSAGNSDSSGLIHECGLAPMYHRVFTPEEQRAIEARQGDFPFTRGEYIASRLGEADMTTDLANFSQRFCNGLEDRFIAARLKSVGAQFLVQTGDWYALHLFIQETIRDGDTLRMQLTAARAFTKECCEQHIRYSLQILQSFPPGVPQGEHLGYWVMSHLLEEETNYDRALHYVEQGLHQGWQGSWESRIAHLKKLAPPRSTKTTIVNLGGNRTSQLMGQAKADSVPVPIMTERSVACSHCGQKMRIPATFTKPFGACVSCGNRVDIPAAG